MNLPKNPAGGAAPVKQTLVEEGTHFKGSLTSTCPIVVQGSIDGSVEGPSLSVSATGSVSGTIIAGDLTSAGRIAGEFDVDTAQVSGTVASNTVIHSSALELKLAVETGKLQLTFGQGSRDGSRGRS